MGGGILQLVAKGVEDLMLTSDPQVTPFKIVYRRYTEFAMMDYPIKIQGDLQFGGSHMIKLGPVADKLGQVSLIIDVPEPKIEIKKPTIKTIKSIINPYGIDLLIDKKSDSSEKFKPTGGTSRLFDENVYGFQGIIPDKKDKKEKKRIIAVPFKPSGPGKSNNGDSSFN